ncbi:GNAT family N-acetyltransferase [Actinoplanes couchii]|uniref:GNAT family N-acetyltransferase n=1 Tax=Actinoplanes couchii TaxID=403638 RepID=UPI0035A24F53
MTWRLTSDGDGATLQTPPIRSPSPRCRPRRRTRWWIVVRRPQPTCSRRTRHGGRPVPVRGRHGPEPVRLHPPAYRRKGFGGAATTAATRNALDLGATELVLFTDLAKSASNALYPRLGYRPIEDRAVVEFAP